MLGIEAIMLRGTPQPKVARFLAGLPQRDAYRSELRSTNRDILFNAKDIPFPPSTHIPLASCAHVSTCLYAGTKRDPDHSNYSCLPRTRTSLLSYPKLETTGIASKISGTPIPYNGSISVRATDSSFMS
jgi:hypothetical protein